MKQAAKLVTGILGGGKAPKTSPAPVVETVEEKKKAKTARSALLNTEGGLAGQELLATQVASKRDTLFGN